MFIENGVLGQLVLFFPAEHTKTIVKLSNFPLIRKVCIISSTDSKFFIAILYSRLIRKLNLKVLLPLPLYINTGSSKKMDGI